MLAAILAVGSELLGTRRLDTNSLRLTGVVARYGLEVRRKRVVGDLEAEIGAEIRDLATHHRLLLITGGLGPTADDVTREGVAAALGLSLEEDPQIVRALEERFAAMGRRLAPSNLRQALVPEGAVVLPNPRGTAPGLRLDAEVVPGQPVTIFLFPGVPVELEGLIESCLVPWLAAEGPGGGREKAFLKVTCVPESELEETLRPAYAEFGRERISVLAKPGEITIEVVAEGPELERRRELDSMVERVDDLVGAPVFSRQETEGLEEVVGRQLGERGMTVGTAESCTGGLIGERMTRVAGSSSWFEGSLVTYSNRLKQELLAVPARMLEEEGAVSEAVARKMAEAARSRLGVDWAIAVTGIAGPGGGTPEKPVGTVHFAWAGAEGATWHRQVCLPGDRTMIRQLTSEIALEGLRQILLRGETGEVSWAQTSAAVSDGGSVSQNGH